MELIARRRRANQGDQRMAVAYDQISTLVTRDVNHRRAGNLAVEAYDELGAALSGYLRANLRCTEDANDLAQEVYLRIARHKDVNQIQSLKSFTFTIAKNLLRDKSRRCATKLAANCVHEDDVKLESATCDPLQQIEADEMSNRVESTIANLSPACREAYRLSRTYHMSYSAIAEHMSVSVSMVEKHISAALGAIRGACDAY